MPFKLRLKDNAGPKPSVRVRPASQKPLNSTHIGIRSKHGSDCVNPAIVKDSINWRRINREANRHNHAIARFIPLPVLVKNDGSRSIPKDRAIRQRFMQAAIQAGSR